MQLAVLGLNHKTAPVVVRERFSIAKDKIRKCLQEMDKYPELHEVVVLSTCNRSELYAVVDEGEGSLEVLKKFWADLTGSDCNIDQYLYSFVDEECIRHLFYVASSLDSLVIGEGQILSQVKEAYAISLEEGATSTVMNTLMHRAITTGKRVRTETRIAFNAVSVSYAAVELARNVFGTLENSSVLVFGAGKMAELTLENLIGKGVKKVFVANRHRDKAEELAQRFGGETVNFDRALLEASEADIVITSTGAPHYVVHSWDVVELVRRRQGRPVVFIDIAVPRDVDPEVGEYPSVKLFNIDNLNDVVDEHLEERQQEAEQAKGIVEEEIASILERFRYLSIQPLMARLARRSEHIRRREVKRARTKLGGLTDEQLREVEQMSHMIVRKLLRFPMMTMSGAAGTDYEAYYVKAMSRLFKLDVPEEMKEWAAKEKKNEE